MRRMVRNVWGVVSSVTGFSVAGQKHTAPTTARRAYCTVRSRSVDTTDDNRAPVDWVSNDRSTAPAHTSDAAWRDVVAAAAMTSKRVTSGTAAPDMVSQRSASGHSESPAMRANAVATAAVV